MLEIEPRASSILSAHIIPELHLSPILYCILGVVVEIAILEQQVRDYLQFLISQIKVIGPWELGWHIQGGKAWMKAQVLVFVFFLLSGCFPLEHQGNCSLAYFFVRMDWNVLCFIFDYPEADLPWSQWSFNARVPQLYKLWSGFALANISISISVQWPKRYCWTQT